MDKTRDFDYMDPYTWDKDMKKEAADAALALVTGVGALIVGMMVLVWSVG